MKRSILEFKKLHKKLELSHHPFNRSYNYLKWAFKQVNFEEKSVLDIGGGNGIYSYYAKFKGANECINLEPFEAGSGNVNIIEKNVHPRLNISFVNETFQKFSSKQKFDIIILHDSINHLDEEAFSKIHFDEKSKIIYQELIDKVFELLSKDGIIIITDCSRYNFWNLLGLKSPFAPSIEWNLHQSPLLIKDMFLSKGISSYHIRWSPFKRFGAIGRFLSLLGFIPSYFMQSHFNLIIRR